MRTRHTVIALVVLASALVARAQTPTPAPKAPDLTGKWTMSLELSIGPATTALDLKQDGEKITGTYTGRYGTSPLQGTLKGRALQFAVQLNAEGQDVTMNFSGEVAADAQSMKGQATIEGLGDATWTARRDKGGPP